MRYNIFRKLEGGTIIMLRDVVADMKSLLDYSNYALLISDPEGKILYVTPSIEKVSGLNMATHLGRNIRDLLNDKLLSGSATLQALNKKEIVTCRVKTIAGISLMNTALPLLDSQDELKRVVCNIRCLKQDHYDEKFSGAFPDESGLGYSYPFKVIKVGEHDIVVESKKMNFVTDLAMQVGRVDSTVVIHGETGVGKELIARLIHSCSPRSGRGSFVKVNCASFSPNLIESELFGYEPGSFTGALRNGKAGYFEMADKGTIFLDEIGELSLEGQAKLLGVLQDRELYRIGGVKPRKIDIRIIAATNKNLADLIEKGKFRKDLFYRLNVIPIQVPPLREREDDIPALIEYFSHKLQKQYFIMKEFSPDLVDYLISYSWPGNVRELYNLVERLIVTTPQELITADQLSAPYLTAPVNTPFFLSGDGGSSNSRDRDRDRDRDRNNGIGIGSGNLKDMVNEFETAIIKKTMANCSTQEEAAELLGISLSSLARRLRRQH